MILRRLAGQQAWVGLFLGCAVASVGMLARGQEIPARPAASAVAATVGGEPITVGQVLEFMHHVLAEHQVTSQTTAFVEAQALGQLIDRKLVGMYLDRHDISASSTEIEAALKKIEDQASGQPGGLTSALAGRGISLDEFRKQLAWDVRWAKYLTQEVTEKELQAYFDEHRADFDGTQVRVSHLLLRPDAVRNAAAVQAIENKALAIRQEIVSGRLSFADAARKYSDAPSRRQGGDLGFIPRGEPADRHALRPAPDRVYGHQAGR
jgi:parvulin-like peptidyl-prolyl isomerase